MPRFILIRLFAAIVLFAAPAGADEAAETLTLDAAIARALKQAPSLKSLDSAVAAGDGEKLQASALPNPSLQMQAENFAGQGVYRGANTAEFSVGVAQLIEIGGKRDARVAVAEQGLELSRRDRDATLLDTIRDVTAAYMNVAMAQENLELAQEQEKLAQQFLDEVNRRVNVAAVPLVQKSKSEITVATARFARERAQREVVHARHMLAGLLGGHHENFVIDTQSFYQITPPQSEEAMEAALAKNPDMQRWEAQKTRSKALYALEQANAVPDPTVSVGVRQLRGVSDGGFGTENSNAFIAGLSIPIPLFNSNEGNIAKARHEIAKSEADEAAASLVLRNAAYQACEDMLNAYEQANSLKGTILPASEESYRLARQGYGLGRFSHLEVLDAQRTLFDAKAQYLASLKEYHTARAQIERFTGQHASSSPSAVIEAHHAK